MIEGLKVFEILINRRVIVSPRMPTDSQNMHWEECQISENEGEREMKAIDRVIELLPLPALVAVAAIVASAWVIKATKA